MTPNRIVCRLFVPLIALSAASCVDLAGEPAADTKNIEYRKDGLAFSHPANWKVTEDNPEIGARYLFVESPGDALVMIFLFSDEPEGLEAFAKDFAQNRAQAEANVRIDGSRFKPHTRTVGERKYEGFVETFNVTVLDNALQHTCYYYQTDDGVHVCAQVATEDLQQVEPGFDTILGTITAE